MLHRNARRDFSVEIKSAVRRNATIIPPREPKPTHIRQKPLVTQSAEAPLDEPAHVQPAQTGRVLQSLIVPEPPPAPIEAAPPEPKARRPYTRRAKPVPAMAIETASPAVAPEPVDVPALPPPVSVPSERKRASVRDGAQQLALGQRWKRRLSRWSR